MRGLFQRVVPAVLLAVGFPTGMPGQESTVEMRVTATEGFQVKPNTDITDVNDLEVFVDGIVESYMEKDNIAGVTLSIVRDGETVLAKGYGISSQDSKGSVDPERTLFRIGSISKTFTWTAIMQLVEGGRLTLDDPVNDHLPNNLQIPDERFAEPVRIRHLMTHTPGFEDVFQALFVPGPGEMTSLTENLAAYRPARVRPPGKAMSYSNYGVALAGAIIQHVSGVPFEDYIEENILDPLGLDNITFRQPWGEKIAGSMSSELSENLSTGFSRQQGGFEAHDFVFVPLAPAGSISAAAADMARWMLVHLGDGSLGESRVLQPETVSRMRQTLFSNAEELPGSSHGFLEYRNGKYRGYGHAGGILYFLSNMVLVPELNLGFFISTNTATGGPLAFAFHKLVLERYFPDAEPEEPPEPPQDFSERGQRFAGTYLTNRRSYTKLEKFFTLAIGGFTEVSVTEDGYLVTTNVMGPSRWVEVSPRVFREVDESNYLVFLENHGEVSGFSSGAGVTVDEKAGLLDSPNFLGSVLLLSLITVLGILMGAWGRRKTAVGQSAREAWSDRTLVMTAAVWAVFFALFGVAMGRMAVQGNEAIYDYPPPLLKAALALGVAAALAGAFSVLTLIPVWRDRNWPAGRRLRHTVAVVIIVVLVLTLNQWNVIGMNYF